VAVTDVSVIIVSYNTRPLLAECLQSVLDCSGGLAVEAWVVDNASTDDSADMVAADFPMTRLIRNRSNAGFAAANNQALRQATGRCLLLLNPDARLLPGCLPALTGALQPGREPAPGICGPQLLNPDGTVQPSWGDFPTPWTEFLFQTFLFKVWPVRFPYGRRVHPWLQADYRRSRPVGWVTGAALMLRREVFAAIGGLSEGTFMYGEDLDYCARAAQAGFGSHYVPDGRVVHQMQAASRQDYARWIEHYTRATLVFQQTYGPPKRSEQVARLILLGSYLRLALWSLLGAARPERRPEVHSRRLGYRRAIALARASLRPDLPGRPAAP
jgi:GT2 family glycosyltransferase